MAKAREKSLVVPDSATPQLVEIYLQKFRSDERYFLADQAITELVTKFPGNSVLEHVLLKVTTINDLYGTQIYSTFQMAHHIQALKIDSHLAKGSTGIVDRIAAAIFSDKPRQVFSFASKYCSWHRPNDYPLYDYFVAKLLLAYAKKDHFADFRENELRNYGRYKRIISAFRHHNGLQRFSFKELDKFLWLYGKDLYPKKYKAKRP